MSGECLLCGHVAGVDHPMLGSVDEGPLCHWDDHSCYHLWTVYGVRP